MTEAEIKAKLEQDLAAAKAEVETAKAATASAQAEEAKAKKSLADGEVLIGKWGTEIGSLRKTVDELKASTISKGTAGSGDNKDEGKTEDLKKLQDEVDARQAQLSETEQAKLDAVYAGLKSKADKGDAEAGTLIKRIHEDLKFRGEFISAAHSGSTSLPDTWRKSPKDKQAAAAEDIKATVGKIFATEIKRSKFIPAGSNGGANASNARGAPEGNQKTEGGEWFNRYAPMLEQRRNAMAASAAG